MTSSVTFTMDQVLQLIAQAKCGALNAVSAQDIEKVISESSTTTSGTISSKDSKEVQSTTPASTQQNVPTTPVQPQPSPNAGSAKSDQGASVQLQQIKTKTNFEYTVTRANSGDRFTFAK